MKSPRFQHLVLLCCSLFLCGASLFAQNPTNQDCLNAIPICQNVYSTTASYSGEGTFPNEINNGTSCLGSGELNDVWYTFTVQASGNLDFTITPNNSSDDYDWSVYNLTNNSCSDIYTNPGLEVSCNFSATPGNTGPDGGSSMSSQPASGTPFNQVVPVVVGQTYVINVSNFSSSQNGYTINFGASSATIFDNIPPQILSVTNPGCGGNTLTVTFSENILCNTVQNSDFSITGPGGPYTVTNVSSVACSQGAQYDNVFTITISPSITGAGTYTANLVGPVTDLCGNIAIYPAQLPFTVGSFTYTNSSTSAACTALNGTATVTTVGGGPFTYSWSPNVSTTNSAIGLGAGVYTVTITDQSTGCSAVDTIHVNANNTLNVNTSWSDSICPGQSSTMSATVLAATPPIVYTWSGGLLNQASNTVTPLSSITYTLNIVDANGCTAGPLLFPITIAGPVLVGASGASPICAGGSSTLNANASGGDGNFTYNWMPGNLNGATVTMTPATTTTYTVTATDGCGQTATQTVLVVVQQLPVLSFTADTTHGCTPLYVHFSIDTTGFGNASFLWDFDDNGATSIAAIPNHNFTTPGCHNVSLTVTVPPGCSVTQTYPCMIKTLQQPSASFAATPTITDILNPTIELDNTSSNATSWYWNYGDSTNSVNFEQDHTYEVPGIYPVYLIAMNDSGCSDTAWINIVVNDYHTFFVPNAFTPDDNGQNEVFIPEFTNIIDAGYTFRIFDRWGHIVFETNSVREGWNGTWKNNGKPVEMGVYVYTINYTDNMNKVYKLVGHVSLIR
jgi:gliding motility-associated-like protein